MKLKSSYIYTVFIFAAWPIIVCFSMRAVVQERKIDVSYSELPTAVNEGNRVCCSWRADRED